MARYLFLLGFFLAGIPAEGFELYVAPSGGDQNPGTASLPLASLSGARDRLRTLRAAGSVPAGAVTVWLRAGNYDQPATLAFDASDSGTALSPVVYAAYPGEEAHLTGAATLNPAWFAVVTSASPVWNRLDASAQGQVYQVDLKSHGITNWGSLQPRGFGLRAPAPLELFVNGQSMTLARWPNVGDALARTNATTSSTQFTYTGSRPARWTQATDAWMHGFWSQDWADFHVPVASVNPAASTVTLAAPPAQYGLGAARPYYAYNLLEELDTPGEYYLDRSSGILYYWPATPLTGSVIQVSMLETPIAALAGTSYVSFRGVVFEAARGALVTVAGGSNIVLDHCLLRNAGQYGAQISGTSNGISHSQIASCGEEGVRISGGDRASLTPGNNYVKQSQIHATGRIDWTYKPAINLEGGSGNSATNNLIDDLPHAAILFTGNNQLMAYNEIWHVCQVTGDSGAIYCGRNWGYRGNVIEHNYLHDISSTLGSADVNGVYLDDCMSGVTLYSNIFYQISGTALFCGGGRDNLMSNNLIVSCGTAHYNDDRGRTMINNAAGDAWNLLQTLGADNVQYNQGTWASTYPALLTVPNSWTDLQQGLWRNPQNCVFSHNAGWANAAWAFESNSSGTGVFSVYTSMTDNDPQQAALFSAGAAEDRSQRAVTLTATGMNSFTPVPFAAIGPDLSGESAAQAAPSAPLVTAVAPSATQADLRWSTLAGLTHAAATTFAVQVANGSSWITLQSLGGQVDFTSVTGLNASSTYTFRVVAQNAAGTNASNGVTVTTPAAPLLTGAVIRIEAENPINVVHDVKSNGTIGVSDGTLDSGASVMMYDAGDAIRINFTVDSAGLYELGLRARSGGSTGPTAFWPTGYAAALDGSAVALVGDPATLSALDPAYGGCFWGTMVSAPIALTAGSHSLVVTTQSNWAAVDCLDVTAMIAAASSPVVTGTVVANTSASTAATTVPNSSDVGEVNAPGSSSFVNGVYTLTGSGADIWNSTVGFHFNSQVMTGDGVITARIASLQNTDGWAKAGVMIRDSNDPEAAYAAMFVTAANGVALQWGAGNGAPSGSAGAAGAAPDWVRLTRIGNKFTAESSPDGANWTTVGTATVTMGTAVNIGLAVTSHNPGTSATAVFDSVTLVGTAAKPDTTTAVAPTPTATTSSPASATDTSPTSTPSSTPTAAAATTPATATTTATAASSAATTSSPPTATAVSSTGGTSSTSSPASVVSSSLTSTDVGDVAIPGSATVTSGGAYTLIGAGADIWNSSVGFQFDYQSLSGDGSIIARVTSLQNTDSWAKAGIMIRDTTASQGAYAAVFLTGANGAAFQGGAGNGASSWSTGAWGALPYWVRLTRAGDQFTADCSADGVYWTTIGTATVPMNNTVCIGLCVTSHNAGQAAKATFDSVSISGAAPTVTAAPSALSSPSTPSTPSASATPSTPATPTAAAAPSVSATPSAPIAPSALGSAWSSNDIGSVGTAGTAAFSNGTYQLTGSGADIWNSSIGFQYAWQSLSADGTITARIASVQNTDAWTKAGIMIRAGGASDPTAPFAALFATPGNGLAFQWRNVANWDCGSQTIANAGLPGWVRLTRAGTTITASTSADGITWKIAGTVSLSPSGSSAASDSFTVGLAVTSHNNSATAAATFDSVSLSSTAP